MQGLPEACARRAILHGPMRQRARQQPNRIYRPILQRSSPELRQVAQVAAVQGDRRAGGPKMKVFQAGRQLSRAVRHAGKRQVRNLRKGGRHVSRQPQCQCGQ